jgi:hypothetical protein
MTPRPWARLAPVCLIGLLGACSDSENPFDSLGDEEIPTDVTDVAALFESHTRALNERDSDAYVALLDPGFRFYIFENDALDFPWLPQDYWEHDAEAGMIANMTDPEFSGDEPPVQSIRAAFNILNERELAGGLLEVIADAIFEVLTVAERWVVLRHAPPLHAGLRGGLSPDPEHSRDREAFPAIGSAPGGGGEVVGQDQG